MPELRSEQAEFDAKRVARIWINHGKDKAVVAYRQIVERVNMLNWEGVIFTARVRELIGEAQYEQNVRKLREKCYGMSVVS